MCNEDNVTLYFMGESDLMDVKEVAAVLGVTVGRVRQLASAGKLKGERLGGPDRGLWVFRRADVEEYARRPRSAGRPRKE